MTSEVRKQAEELARRTYTEVVFRDKTTDDESIYMAVTPELEGCMAQGETVREAQENLRLFRIDYIEHLVENNLPVPDPSWMATQTEADSIELPLKEAEPSFDDVLKKVAQPKQREQLFEARLIVNSDLVKHG